MEEWIQLNNFSKYEFCLSPLKARSKISKKIFDGFELDKYNRKKIHSFYSDSGERYVSTVQRMVFCAYKGIDPFKIKGHGILTTIGENGVVLTEMPEIRKRYNREIISEEELLRRYKESIDFSSLVISAFENNDFSMVENYLLSKKKLISQYISIKRHISDRKSERIAELSISECIIAIKGRKVAICSPISYMMTIASNISNNSHKKEIQYKESVYE